MSTSSERGRGRPQAGQREGLDPRDTLIEIAAERFARQGFEGTSLRQVAEGADVTPAMVAYYFRDKSGLLEAVVRKG
ncbi:MAG: TetR family transcriptional regulator, partial [Pseudomonadales bacterium]